MAASSSIALQARLGSLSQRSDPLFSALMRVKTVSGVTFPEPLLRPEEGRPLRSYSTGVLSSNSPLFSELNRLAMALEEGSEIRTAYNSYIKGVCEASEGKPRWKLLKGEVRLIVHLNSQTFCWLIPRKLYRNDLKNRLLPRRRADFEPGEAGAEAAQLKKFSDEGEFKSSGKSTPAETDFSSHFGIAREMVSLRSPAPSDAFFPAKLENIFVKSTELFGERRISQIFEIDHKRLEAEEGADLLPLLASPSESFQSSLEALFAMGDANEQEELSPFFSELTRLKLSCLKLDEAALIKLLQQVAHLEELTIDSGESVSPETLQELFRLFPRVRLTVSESPHFSAASLAQLIQFAWDGGHSLSFLIGGQSYQLTPGALDLPFREAVLHVCPEFAKAVALKGGRVDLPELLKAAIEQNSLRSLFLMADLGFQCDQGVEGETLFHWAAKSNRAEWMKTLFHLDQKPWEQKLEMVNRAGVMGRTPLHIAALHRNLKAVQALLEIGADPLRIDDHQETPLALALRSNADEVVRLLIAPSLYSESEPFEEGSPPHEIFSLEKLSTAHLEKGEYRLASLTLGRAFLIARHHLPSYLPLLERQLDRIESLYLFKSLQILTPPSFSSQRHHYRARLEELRLKTAQKVERGGAIREIQKEFSEGYQKIISNLFQDSLDRLPPSPGGHALIALDELSRNEIFPSSAVRLAIVVKKRRSIDFFKNVAKLLEIKMAALGFNDLEEENGRVLEADLDFAVVPNGSILVGTASGVTMMLPKVFDSSIIVSQGVLLSSFRIGLFKKRGSLFEGGKEKKSQAIDDLSSSLREWRKAQSRLTPDRRGFEIEKDLYDPFKKILRPLILYFGAGGTSTYQGLRGLPFKPQIKKALSELLDRLSFLVMQTQLSGVEVSRDEKRRVHRLVAAFYQRVSRFVDSPGIKPFQSTKWLSSQEERPLHLAIERGEVDRVRDCIGSGERVDLLDLDGYNALHIAASVGHAEILDLLLNAKGGEGALVARAPRGETALHLAVKAGSFDSAALLLERGAELVVTDESGKTPFDIALKNGDDGITSLLLFQERERVSLILGALSRSATSSSSTLPPHRKTLSENEALRLFSSAVQRGDLHHQLFWMLKLSLIFLERGDYRRTALILNSAYAVAQDSSLLDGCRQLLLSQLERVERRFIRHEVGRVLKGPGRIHHYRLELKRIREGVAASVESGQPMDEVLKGLTESYKALLRNLLADSIKAMEKEPPIFAMAGLGSMSRDEMCPYSDVEFIFLVEEESRESLAYFRSLARLMMFKILNLGETEFKLAQEESGDQKSITPNGFSMDSGLSPLGTNELYGEGLHQLIGTPEQLAQFQTESGGAEIILVNAMRTVCWVDGKHELVERYKEAVRRVLDTRVPSSSSESAPAMIREERALELMRGFVDEFKPKLDQDKIDLRAFDVKKELYRLPQTVISGLALYYGLESTNTFDQIDELERRGVISYEGGERLKQALSLILSLRVQAHLFYKTECETLYHSREEGDKEAEGLFIIDSEVNVKIAKIYRTLSPFHKAILAFLEGGVKSLDSFSFYNASVGGYNAQLREECNYEEALQAAYELVIFHRDSFSSYNLGLIHSDLGQPKESLQRLEESYLLLKKKHGDQPHRKISYFLTQIGTAYYQLGRYNDSIRYLKQSLNMKKQIYGEKTNEEIAVVLNNLALTYYELGKFDRSKECLEESLVVIREIYLGRPHHKIATALNNLAAVYLHLGQSDRAIEYSEEALEMYQQLYDNRSRLGAASVFVRLGEVSFQLGNYVDAIDRYEQALKVYEQYYGDRPHHLIAICLSSLGTLYSRLGDQAHSIEYLEKSLKKVNDDQPHLRAGILGKLGNVYNRLGKHDVAIDHYQQSVAIYKQVYGDQPDSSVALSLHNLGDSYMALDQPEHALGCCLESLAILKQIYGDRPHPDIAQVLSSLGATYGFLSEHLRAIDYFQQAYLLFKQVHNNQPHLDMVKCLEGLGCSHHALSDDRLHCVRAIDCFELSLEILAQISNDQLDHQISNSLMMLGKLYNKLKETKNAIKYLRQAYIVFKRIYGSQPDPYMIACLDALGLSHLRLRQHDRGIEYLEQSLAMKRLLYGDQSSLDIAGLLFVLGEAYVFSNLSKAVEYLNNAYDMFVETVGIDDPLTQDAGEALATLAEALLA